MQDCRGCFGSGGDVNFLIPEAEDGADTMVWINRQSWCNSRIGTWGTSWAGWTQTALAGAGAGQSRHHGPEHERQQRT